MRTTAIYTVNDLFFSPPLFSTAFFFTGSSSTFLLPVPTLPLPPPREVFRSLLLDSLALCFISPFPELEDLSEGHQDLGNGF